MNEKNIQDMKEQEREQLVELGADIIKSSKGNIYTLTIIGQVEGHQVGFCFCSIPWAVISKRGLL